jgi:hypothetical protein
MCRTFEVNNSYFWLQFSQTTVLKQLWSPYVSWQKNVYCASSGKLAYEVNVACVYACLCPCMSDQRSTPVSALNQLLDIDKVWYEFLHSCGRAS